MLNQLLQDDLAQALVNAHNSPLWARAKKLLDEIAKQARARGVRCATVCVSSDLPYQQIIAVARKKKCDLILMASHGRRGLSSLLLGSETSKVLLHSKVPVLVVR